MKLPKIYEPHLYEKDIYALWEKTEAFLPKNRGDSGKFSMVFPLPNANGNLHLGHALTNAIHDILTRYHRMTGKAALYLPGADHAGFETWVVYEKELNKQGKTRFDYSREELYQQVWDFVQLNKDNFEAQFRALGASCDWTRFTFTLDDKVTTTAYKTFKRMWDDKLIYRGERLVNYCTHHGTSFSDIEVVFKDVPGHLWHITYPLTDGSGTLTVATTRPETMLGDTAVAVHPKDARYKEFIGKTVKLPLTQREIPVIADEMVEMEFGTGAVKITPAHDQNDYEVAERHDLPMMTVIDHEGNMVHDVAPAYRGHDVLNARQLVVADLEEQGLISKVEDYAHSVGHCYKCGNVIQPLLRDQWFIDMKPLANQAIKALRDKKINFYPVSKREQSIAYLKNIRDWNISRQIAWGIPIPAFQNVDDPDDWIFDERVTEETIKVGKYTYRRDPDVFDTWFSSGQWPFVTLGYPDHEDFKKFYPHDLMETGFDILYQWVCRMIMLGLYITDDIPFKDVYLHGLVLDEKGQKMSKSKGNVVDPMPLIKEHGSDAVRMGLIAGQTPGNNQPYVASKVISARNFCNKLWNISRYVEDKLGDHKKTEAKPKTAADHWILYSMNYTIESMSDALENYKFSEAYEMLYHFVWDDVADWYIESSKIDLNEGVLLHVLTNSLKLAHPFAPFVTETIWQTLYSDDDTLAVSRWPTTIKADKDKAKTFEDLKVIVTEIRFIKNELKASGLNLYHNHETFIEDNRELLKSLARLKDVKSVKDGSGLNLTQTPYKCWLDVDSFGVHQFLDSLKSKKEAHEASIKQLEGRLSNKSYVKNAPKKVVNETKVQLEEAKAMLAKVKEEYERFNK